MIKILLTDAHLLLRTGFKEALREYSHIQILGEADNGEDCLRHLRNMRPDVVVLDINLPKINGIEVVRRITMRKKPINCLILTDYLDEKYLTESIKAGCKGYMLTTTNAEELALAIENVAASRYHFHSIMPKRLLNMADKLVKDMENKASGNYPKFKPGRKPCVGLTLREVELMNLLGQGLRNVDMAEQLFLSEKTVKNHLTNIFRKLGVKDRTQALLIGVREGWVILPEREKKKRLEKK